jgi:hypothetical protein
VTRTDTSVTKSFADDDRAVSVDKDYFLVDDGDVLLIHHWGDDESTEGFDRFTRIADAPTMTGQSSLHGTWRGSSAYEDDEAGWIENIETLTFTGTRTISHTVMYNTDNREILDTWSEHGGWTDHGTSATLIVFEDDQELSVDKQYVIAGDLLAINPWWDIEPHAGLDVYTRVQDPFPGGMVGSWRFEWVWDRDTEDEQDDLLFTITADVAESITIVRESRTRSGELDHTRTIEATWEFDPEEWLLNLTIIQATGAEGEEEPEVDDHPAWAPGTKRRIAIAPAIPDHILVSYLWDEMQWDGVQWIDRPDNPFGDYWMEWVRQ